MKRFRWPFILIGLPFALCFGLIAFIGIRSNQDWAAYQDQLRLARSEGLPTNGAEYAAYIPTCEPNENSGPLYKRLVNRKFFPTDYVQAYHAVAVTPTLASSGRAEEILRSAQPEMTLIDQAVRLPHCWFDRDWSQGGAVLMPEFATMKNAAKLLALRSALEASRGDTVAALGDIEKIFVLSRQAGEEGTIISRYVSQAIYVIGMRQAAIASMYHRSEPRYESRLAKAVREVPTPDLKAENRDRLYTILWLIENSDTKEGRKKLGIKESYVPKFGAINRLLHPSGPARIEVVKAERDFWASLDTRDKNMRPRLKAACERLHDALAAFPTAEKLYYEFGVDDDVPADRMPRFERFRQEYEALVRALSGPTIATKIKTDDLLSPYDGKPLSYLYDGKRIVIRVSNPADAAGPERLILPFK